MEVEEARHAAGEHILTAHESMARALGGVPSALADGLLLAGCLLTEQTVDLPTAQRLLSIAASPVDPNTARLEAAYLPIDKLHAEVVEISAIRRHRLGDEARLERVAFAHDLLYVAEAVARRIPEGLAGARFAIRFATIPDYSIEGVLRRSRPPIDADEAADLQLLWRIHGALVRARAPR